MATFAKSSFNAAVYSASRPTYPAKLFECIYNYHGRSKDTCWERAVDIGCGPGQATVLLRDRFREVIGIDPSEPMIQKARANFKAHGSSSEHNGVLRFIQGSAESLNETLEDDSVDLLIAAQAAHWFDWSKVWPETRRVLRKNGTAAFWIYSELRFPEHPSLTPLITDYAQGDNPQTSLGPHFQRPGRTILERHLVDVPNPVDVGEKGLGEVERIYFSGDYHPSLPSSQTRPVILKKQMRWRDLLGYLRTWSSLHTYHELYPEDKNKLDERFPEDLRTSNTQVDREDIDVRGGDIAIRFWKDLREKAQEDGARVGVEDTVNVEWPVALILARRIQ
ncbi:S-adenosyl-L-methionine-dependent methyltransferase [Crucibulum laeve]|uniref:S-adenosyl-L-methionine-dependent methyltransferase n=1 Tax=Crucibulum laeve TaxID=68775 RepID=A0A5C3LTU7_9AGAR|nr:S-adenosyl-L-methionine-dependent methyltransferase [Crucibulum laeve]